MRVLVIGDPDSIYVKSVIEHTFLSFGDEVDILANRNTNFKNFYENNHVCIHIRRIGTLFGLLTDLKVLKERFDLVCVHYVNSYGLCMAPLLKKYCKRVVFSYWGSDILRKKKSDLLTRFMLIFVDQITMVSVDMREKFIEFYGRKYQRKISLVDFGLEAIDQMKETICDDNYLYDKYGIPKDKIIIAIGHNTTPAQQHLKVLEVINSLSENDRDKIHIILRLTYGTGTQKYISEIKRKVKKTNCTHTYFESFLSTKEIAEITKLTDIFIHAQITDAKSGTMLEHLYAGCLVINPVWIEYKELIDLFYLTFDKSKSLKEILENNIEKKQNSIYVQRLNKNSEIVYELSSWETWTPIWRKLYEGYNFKEAQ